MSIIAQLYLETMISTVLLFVCDQQTLCWFVIILLAKRAACPCFLFAVRWKWSPLYSTVHFVQLHSFMVCPLYSTLLRLHVMFLKPTFLLFRLLIFVPPLMTHLVMATFSLTVQLERSSGQIPCSFVWHGCGNDASRWFHMRHSENDDPITREYSCTNSSYPNGFSRSDPLVSIAPRVACTHGSV